VVESFSSALGGVGLRGPHCDVPLRYVSFVLLARLPSIRSERSRPWLGPRSLAASPADGWVTLDRVRVRAEGKGWQTLDAHRGLRACCSLSHDTRALRLLVRVHGGASLLASFGTERAEAGQASRAISTARLHVLPRFHLPPINVLVSHGPSESLRSGSAHLEGGFPLRCFQRLSLPDVATRRCPWRDNRYTRGQSIPVLSY
jgi:hypothetical protein